MPTLQTDHEIVAIITDKIGAIPSALTYDDTGRLIDLGLTGLALSHLPPELWQLASLRELDLGNNQLSLLPSEIGKLTSLQSLDLDNNQLSYLPPEIGQLTNLRELGLIHNQLSYLPAEIGQLTNLQLLDLDENKVSQLPPELWQLTRLKELYVAIDQLSQLPPEIGQLTNLQKLSLDTNQLSELPAEIGQLTNLQELYLHKNTLSRLPPELWQLTNLQKLHLNHNQLSELPPEIGQLTNLQELYLHKNALSRLPPELCKLVNLQKLGLDNNQLSQLPAEIGRLTSLQVLDLENNQLSQLPPEIGQLTNLRDLYLQGNQLSELPSEIGQLTHLQELWLNNNQLDEIPPVIGQLTNLQDLRLDDNQLSQLPAELWQLIHLTKLYLNHNRLDDIPPEIERLTNLVELWLDTNQLSQLPPEIGQLTNLQILDLTDNQLSQLPPEFWRLTNLQQLSLANNRLSHLPAELGRLAHLQELYLENNQLSRLPPEIGQLTNLQVLRVIKNQLSQLPLDLWQVTGLKKLWVNGNQLDEIPAEIGQLTNLQELDLSSNKLKRLPTPMGQLIGLQTLNVADMPTLQTPPPEIVARGTAGILAFLRELQESSITRYESKLLIVGEGGTGKSSLLRALRNDPFDPHLSTTHGIEVDHLTIAHSSQEIMLNTWDFGGQHIYHATHQFFLTKRSLYMVVWNARLGVEQGRLGYWLETIKAHAPDAPVLLVATHVDERMPDLNYQLYKGAYPQIVGNLAISNKNGEGIAELKTVLADQALRLPLMGQPWPAKWLHAEQTLLARPEHHIDADTYMHCCATCEVDADIARGSLGNYLHDLGKILYFRDDYVLSNLVVLKPNWVTKAIGRVLADEATNRRQGVLLHADLPRIWAVDEEGRPYEAHLYPIFLRLMERFYLSYQIEADAPGDHSMSSLIPQLLPYQPPISLPTWPKSPSLGQSQVEMVYRFDFVPAGLMSWFIVRTHRFSQHLHWREGVLLAYEGHQGRVEFSPMQRELRLLVQGSLPQNFFTMLMNTVEVILARFEGLKVRREIPCICHWQWEATEPCPHFYRYEELVRRMGARRHIVECPESFNEVSVPELLYGIHMSTDQQVMADIQQRQQEIQQSLQPLQELQKLDVILGKLNQQSELIARNFTRQWNLEMEKMEAECPNTFYLLAGDNKPFDPKTWVSKDYRLYLVCQHPPGPHRVGDGYHLRRSKEWWASVRPWLNHLINFLKFAVPMGAAIGGVYDAIDVKQIQAQVDLLEEMVKDLPEFASLDEAKGMDEQAQPDYYQRTIGPALRALHSFLNEADPAQVWGGLYKTPTLDGNILWLCDQHRQQHVVRPLKLEA